MAKGPSAVERLKETSAHLRGDLAGELAAGGIQVSEDGYNLLKFHGSYEQFDRDTATARKQAKLEKEYQFMVRVRMPGGRLTAQQYLAFDALAGRYANGTLRITTRQGIQFHGILKGDLKASIADINHTGLTTLAACGDVVRNLMVTAAPRRDARHARVQADAELLSHTLLPRTRAYAEIFLDQEPLTSEPAEIEPLYGPTYLPRKFKIGIALPGDNTIDVLTQDLGIVALFDEDETLTGYLIAVGGGLGMTHNRADTFPRLATPVCVVPPDKLVQIVEAVIRLQRDHGDRTDRKRARLKYVVHDRGIDWIRDTLAEYYGEALTPPPELPSLTVPDLLGWHAQGDGRWWLGVPVPSGRIADYDADAGEGLRNVRLRSALREIAQRFDIAPVMTPQQDVLISDVAEADRAAIDAILAAHAVVPATALTPLARFALACPALPTCGLALHEAERVREPFVLGFDALLAKYGLGDRSISLRITGCPNGCARSYTGDIGMVGRMPGYYALYVGGDFEGTRLSFRLLDRVADAQVLPSFEPLFAAWARDGRRDEGFGDFCNRLGRETLLGVIGLPAEAA